MFHCSICLCPLRRYTHTKHRLHQAQTVEMVSLTHANPGLPRWLRAKRIHLPMQEPPGTRVQSPGWEDHLEEEMAIHSSILAWKIPWTEEEPGGLQSMGLQKSQTGLST